jgi:glutamate-1-semialdehyde 2,1-aminomutase
MNTNALAYNPKLIEYLSNFKQAHILLSADGYEEINEYIRWPSKWDKIDQNIKRYTGLGDPFLIGINLTVSIWNIFYIEEILEYFKSYSSFVNINLVHYPKLQSIRNMPRPLKAKVLRQLVQLPDTERLKSFINLQPNLDKELTLEEYQDAILKYVAPLDASRNLDIKTNLPRLYDLLSKPSC